MPSAERRGLVQRRCFAADLKIMRTKVLIKQKNLVHRGPRAHPHPHTLSLSLSLTHTHTHTHTHSSTHSLSLSLSLSHTHTHTERGCGWGSGWDNQVFQPPFKAAHTQQYISSTFIPLIIILHVNPGATSNKCTDTVRSYDTTCITYNTERLTRNLADSKSRAKQEGKTPKSKKAPLNHMMP